MSAKEQFSRRRFLRQTMAASVAVTGASALGAGPVLAAQGTPTTWDAEVDIIVVGTGVAGYAAAIEAKDAGADVMMIEKAKFVGGNSILAGGNCQMPANHINKKAGIEDHVEWAFEDYYNNGEHRGVPEILRVFVEGAADTALWLEKLGIVWRGPTMQTPDNRVPRTITPATSPTYKGSAGVSLIDVLNQNAVKRQIPIKLEHKLTQLIRPDPAGPVVGVVVQNAGKTLNFRAKKAVILATGGFKANHRMVRAWHPQVDEMFNWSGGPYAQTTGDGHLAAMAVGAGLGDASWPCSFIIKFGSPIYNQWEPQTMETPFVPAGLPYRVGNNAVMLVENDGKRFVNEYTFNPSEAELTNPWIAAFLDLPKRPRNVWAIVDSVGAVEMGWKPEQFTDPAKQKNPYLDPKWIATADTIAGLAAKMGIPADGLQATVAKYNLCTDPEFGRHTPYTPIATPPFYAARMAPMTHDQSSGIRVNTKMQVIDQMFQAGDSTSLSVPIDKETVIPHLYGAGEFSNGLFGTSRGHGKMGAYVVLGRVAGKAAVAEKSLGPDL